jgi:hypothetical protein
MSENAIVRGDLFWLMCDEVIGRGQGRTVYSSKVLPNSVIKVEENARSFQNIIEWETWEQLKNTVYAKWLAPCEHISANGAVLVMAKTKPLHKLPSEMPTFLDDFKPENYGIYNGRPVCHDYGINVVKLDRLNIRMRKVKWRE